MKIVESQQRTACEQAMLDLIEAHRVAELEKRDVDATLATMADSPYIYFAPTLSGGDDEKGVRTFYTTMLGQLPNDMKWIPISRTIGDDKIVLESILTFTHDIQVDWLLPGIAPTGKALEIPMVLIFSFENNKIKSERIYWDLASTLKQMGLLQSDTLPIVGVESAKKLQELIGG